MKPSSAVNDHLVDQTIALWQPRIGRELTQEDARQIIENVTGFFSLLRKWSRAKPTSSNDAHELVAASGEVRHEC